jgi:hypothetical protein
MSQGPQPTIESFDFLALPRIGKVITVTTMPIVRVITTYLFDSIEHFVEADLPAQAAVWLTPN